MQLHSSAKQPFSLEQLPKECIKAIKYKNTLSFTTVDQIKLSDRVSDSLQEIYIMTNIVVSELMKEICESISCLYQLAEAVSMIDMLLSFAHNCTLSSYVRPEFIDTMAIKGGLHPILEKIGHELPVVNNTYASTDSNFILITGPNMSGKSTYLRQMAMLQIMAQTGSFVPAEYASFRIADQIYSRIGTDDDMQTNSSSFMLEMREINYIIQNASNTSLIIIDELGRGTSPDEGAGLCHAICEYLLQLKAFIFFTTHFLELGDLDKLYPNVLNYHFECGEDGEILGNHHLVRGKAADEHYGIKLAELSSLPRELLDDARSILKKITDDRWRDMAAARAIEQSRAIESARAMESPEGLESSRANDSDYPSAPNDMDSSRTNDLDSSRVVDAAESKKKAVPSSINECKQLSGQSSTDRLSIAPSPTSGELKRSNTENVEHHEPTQSSTTGKRMDANDPSPPEAIKEPHVKRKKEHVQNSPSNSTLDSSRMVIDRPSSRVSSNDSGFQNESTVTLDLDSNGNIDGKNDTENHSNDVEH